MSFDGVYAGRTVLVTGHTGFKGSWLSLWLSSLGARVVGYALPPDTTPSLFEDARVADRVTHLMADIRDADALKEALAAHRPELVFHLAAQPLVRASYRSPEETFEVNVMGTVRLLEAVRHTPGVRACVVVTTDKCYENREWDYAYRENDPMGGRDPYSASKGCAELVAASYRASFAGASGFALATARAGNVLGGGDWAEDRILPDAIRALSAGMPVPVRNPGAVRPWQHVLEPLAGYLWLGARLLSDPGRFSHAWNFGPDPASSVPVGTVVDRVVSLWGGGSWEAHGTAEAAPHEARLLRLDTAKAQTLLSWMPVYGLEETLKATLAWYAAYHRDPQLDVQAFTLAQIAAYERQAASQGVAWANRHEQVLS